MKKLLVLLLIPLFSLSSFGQDSENNFDALSLCFEYRSMVSSFSSNIKAEQALQDILNSAEISQSFFMQECKYMNGAAATNSKNTRYIHYDPLWMKDYEKNKWLNTFILAHEVGHHYLLHIDDNSATNFNELSSEDKLLFLEKQRKDESKADEFAALVLARLGASLSEIENSGIKDIFYEGDETFKSHPNKESRINAIRVGFSKKDIELINNSENEEFYISSVKKHFNNDVDGSFDDFKKFKSEENLTEKEILDEYQSMVKNFNTTKYVGRCNAITKAKNQCKRSAKPGLSFCWQHNDSENKDILIGRCKGITKTKKQCKRRASENKEFCWQHLIN